MEAKYQLDDVAGQISASGCRIGRAGAEDGLCTGAARVPRFNLKKMRNVKFEMGNKLELLCYFPFQISHFTIQVLLTSDLRRRRRYRLGRLLLQLP